MNFAAGQGEASLNDFMYFMYPTYNHSSKLKY